MYSRIDIQSSRIRPKAETAMKQTFFANILESIIFFSVHSLITEVEVNIPSDLWTDTPTVGWKDKMKYRNSLAVNPLKHGRFSDPFFKVL